VTDVDLPQEDAVVERALPDHPVLRALIEPFEDAEWVVSSGQDAVILPRARMREFAQAARDAGFEMLVDLTVADYYRKRRVRFELVANLISQQHRLRLRMRAPVPVDDVTVPSLVPVYPGANFYEREAYDLFGLIFEDHPDLTRILLPDDWEGHPLRKDHGTGSVPVQFKQSHQVS
jgi:NADH-quinone oxidoreductase subunit C